MIAGIAVAAALALLLRHDVARRRRVARAQVERARFLRGRQRLLVRRLETRPKAARGPVFSLPRCPACGDVLADIEALRSLDAATRTAGAHEVPTRSDGVRGRSGAADRRAA